MELYFLRHAIAEDFSETGRDADRKLTNEGKEKLRHVLKRAAAADVLPSLILSSPYKRAMETAEIAASVLGVEEAIVASTALTPDSSPQAVWEEIREHRTYESILLAGHEPLFSSCVAWFLGSSHAMVDFRKAALMRMDVHGFGASPQGILQWMITPKLS